MSLGGGRAPSGVTFFARHDGQSPLVGPLLSRYCRTHMEQNECPHTGTIIGVCMPQVRR